MHSRRVRILARAQELGALTFGDYTLSSGQKSKYYFDGRLLSLDPEGSFLLGREILSLVRSYGAEAIGGPTIGADPLVSAVVLTSYLRTVSGQDGEMFYSHGEPLRGFLVRPEMKAHGTGKVIEGPLCSSLESGASPRVVIVDDTCSTGGSLFHAIDTVEANGCIVVAVVAVLDRHQGGSDRVLEKGYPFSPLLEADSLGAVRPVTECCKRGCFGCPRMPKY